MGTVSIFIPMMNAKGTAMLSFNHLPSTTDLRLPQRAVFTLPQAAGVQLRCREGSLWITLDNDPRDIVLEAGESFTVPDDRRAVIYALEAACVGLRPAAQAQPAAVQSSTMSGPWIFPDLRGAATRPL